MAEILEKLRPDRDLQCYFERPSAVAALSGASANGFTISGCWRQQFDWAVLEWNRDNVFEHPAFRNLPDGDLSGLQLTYDETRTNCIPIDSDLYPTVDWPYLRVWLEGVDDPCRIPLRDCATPVEGDYQAATAELELHGAPAPGEYIGLSWLSEQYNYQLNGSDTLESAAAALAGIIGTFSSTVHATATGARIVLTCREPGANWNRVGVYGFVAGARAEYWQPWWARFSGGASPSKWRIHLDFGSLLDHGGAPVPMNSVRKMRWTYAADLQPGAYGRSEFEVRVSNWTVTGTGRAYQVAGPGSRRIEDDSAAIAYGGNWAEARGNYSGGTIRFAEGPGPALTCTYRAPATHRLLLGTRKCDSGSRVSIAVDGGTPVVAELRIPGEDVLVRVPLGVFGPGQHTMCIESLGPEGKCFWFDFLEIAVPANTLPAIGSEARLTLAADWDTDHSICLAPERTAWMIESLGFRGRVNHYVGAMWFYELERAGHQYASATVEFTGTPQFGQMSEVRIGRSGDPASELVLTHVHRIGDTAETVAKAFELELNRGYMSVWAQAQGNVLAIHARAMGVEGNCITLAAAPVSGLFVAQASGPALSGGVDGVWRTDLAAVPRLNRAVRDWSRSFFAALHAAGLDATAAFSMELQHGDASVEAGIAQRCPAGDPVLLPTPALQTNFSPVSLAFWKQVYREMAGLMEGAGVQPYLQFGEVQWWYFREHRSGMPFYDDYTKAAFQAAYGREMGTIFEHTVPPAQYPDETAFLPSLIGSFTNEIVAFVRQAYPACRFEVLYPLDVNETEFNRAINFPAQAWTPAALECLKTEAFGFTYGRNLDKAATCLTLPGGYGFPPHRSAHLVGIGDAIAPWRKETWLAAAGAVESVVLFALDQFCLIGYPAPLPGGRRHGRFQG